MKKLPTSLIVQHHKNTSARASSAAIGLYDVGCGVNNGAGDANSSTSSAPGGVGRELQVLPASEIWFAHKKYRVVVCLDLSTSVFHQRWGDMPADSFVDAVMLFVEVSALCFRVVIFSPGSTRFTFTLHVARQKPSQASTTVA